MREYLRGFTTNNGLTFQFNDSDYTYKSSTDRGS